MADTSRERNRAELEEPTCPTCGSLPYGPGWPCEECDLQAWAEKARESLAESLPLARAAKAREDERRRRWLPIG